MGTSQSISPGVSGEPNWGKTSSAASNLANTLSKEKSNPELANSNKFKRRKNSNLRNLLKNYIRAAGGSGSISSGKSSKGGKAAFKTSVALGGSLYHISQVGLEEHLSQKGFVDFRNRTKEEVIFFLLEDICVPTSNFDEAAAKSALDKLLESIFENTDDSASMSEMIQEYLEGNSLDSIIVEYFGTYISDHLFQPIQEKLFESKGQETCHDTMREVHDFIMSELEFLRVNNELKNINWDNDTEVNGVLSNIFNNAIKVFEDE